MIKQYHLLSSAILLLFIVACSAPKELSQTTPSISIDSKRNLDAGIMEKYKASINPTDLKKHLYIIASDDFEGRNTASRGLKMAADYISDFYHNNGLVGPVRDKANPYLQPILFLERKVATASIAQDNLNLTLGKDFAVLNSGEVAGETELVFGGYGVELSDYQDLANLDLKGKSLLIISGEPMNSKGEALFNVEQDSFFNIQNLKKRGISNLFVTMPHQEIWDSQSPYLSYISNSIKPVHTLDESELNPNRDFNSFYISPSKVAEIFGVSPKDYFEKIQKNLDAKKTLGGLFPPTKVSMNIGKGEKMITSNNIAAFIEGTDLKKEVIVISSHYDHVGMQGGQIHNGADDDGSGTVGVMEIAQAFSMATKDGYRPRRSILFLNVTGEEKGLFGSAYYADKAPLFPLKNTTTNLNIDMIGRVDDKHKDQPNYVYIIGSDMLSSELHAVHEKVAKKHFPEMELDYEFNGKEHPDRFYYRSDHYNFAKNNIPVIFYFNGTHEDYHKPTDTPDKINYEVLAKRAQLIFATAWELANRDNRPVVDKSDD